ncbi:ZYRO0D05456p [Zygosaccharomyces rouxii]|uniref:ZYRO0D05456p n=1 Tax=Zygosaccharomyces rouxii (strain ATCC 2623 / CBS 732 / NBRC 1130 / NCYC 568 / NRRL Y-229) TaxID=559307 RepID=C5DVB9_ZYGRC|nr:uncharacterized protein ZYRO0D05456g [Zygosaccharomyces rouxii]KAH9200651.1 hypothetical protein LQ764DRAFT_227296 [Zygosaccharomyces rouxii]CAR27738.1 ZYRO0D05456p [Zygosaccharomyces rouxii]
MADTTTVIQPAGQPKNNAFKRIIDFYTLEAHYTKDCIILVLSNFTSDLFTNIGIVIYPFLGVLELVRHGDYYYFLMSFLVTYLVELVCVAFLYFVFLFPFTVAAYGILGPMGFPLAIIHGIQFSNLVACHEVRRDKVRGGLNLLRLIFTRHKMSSVLLTPDTIHPRPEDHAIPWIHYVTTIEFWGGALPSMTVQYLIALGIFMVWYMVSLIPIVGVLLLKFHTSPHRGFDYVLPFYKDVRQYDKRALTRIYYGGYARWLLLGASTGILESIPILAGVAVCTNLIGCTLWEISMVRDHQAKKKPI